MYILQQLYYNSNMDEVLLTVHDYSISQNLSEDALRKAIRFGRLHSIKQGRCRYITDAWYRDYRKGCFQRALNRKGVQVV